MYIKKIFQLSEAAEVAGVEVEIVTTWIEREWIVPAEPDKRQLDQEDVARIKLIQHLQSDMGINEEGIPVILHLLDQLYHLHYQLKE